MSWRDMRWQSERVEALNCDMGGSAMTGGVEDLEYNHGSDG